jgi:hypothetical protein
LVVNNKDVMMCYDVPLGTLVLFSMGQKIL